MSNLVQRTLSGIIYVSVVLSSIILVDSSYWVYFALLMAAISGLAQNEYHKLVGSSRWESSISIALAVLLSGSTSLCFLGARYVHHSIKYTAFICIALYLILGMAYLISELFTKAANPIKNWGHFFISQIMIAQPLALLCLLGGIDKAMLLALFVIIWVNDTGAYCIGSLTGKLLGNHKMFPRVSPGKSWEGLIGGIAFALIAGWLFARFNTTYTLVQWLVIALTIAISGTIGDLMESLFKRTIGIKDSGHFMPGHGGVLDRFDSILFATPCLWLLTLLYIL